MSMNKLEIRFAPSLNKSLGAELPPEGYVGASALLGERFYFQICYRLAVGEVNQRYYDISCGGDLPCEISDLAPAPADYPCYPDADGDYLVKTPALVPDIVMPRDGELSAVAGLTKSLLVCVDLRRPAAAGSHKLVFTFTSTEESRRLEFDLTVIAAELPKQSLIYTQWFHSDCIATYYNAEVFSEKHWSLIEKYLRCAADHGQNMILTPLLTPALDTQVGTERPTVQLVDVYVKNGKYSFGYKKLDRWLETAKRAGFEYFEMSHMFTQWGALHAPKVMAKVDGEYKRIFGWETDADDGAYTEFVVAFLKALKRHLVGKGIFERCYFHVSDEPSPEYLERYLRRAEVIKRVIPQERITDALSHYDFYERGALTRPIPAINCIGPFIEHRVPRLWTYYCCGQGIDVSNRFIAMPGQRTRIIGLQFYKFGIEGFLQWGYNFWYGHLSKTRIDPYRTTSGNGVFPSGDPFSVYPGEDGPLCSLRQILFEQALYDLSALKLLESKIGREATVRLAEEGIDPVTFTDYPREGEYVNTLRERINRRIAEEIK